MMLIKYNLLHRQKMNDFSKVLGARIKQARHAARLTQVVFAERCQIYRSYLTNIEAGKANPSLLVLLRIAVQLEVPLWQLMQVDPRAGWREIEGTQLNETQQTLEYVQPQAIAISKSMKKLSTKKGKGGDKA
jgi:transcriptional regulator with XRE-family HTH domain